MDRRKPDPKAVLAQTLPFLLVVLAGIAIIAPVLGAMTAQIAPDSMPYFGPGSFMRNVETVLANRTSAPPSLLYWLVFPPLVAHELTYLCDAILVAVAAALYLRGRMVAPSLAWLGGAALGFSGYSFTLISAGHRGYFHMMACTVFVIPLLSAIAADTRPLARRWPAYVLLGLAAGWGVLTQPDVFVLVAALAAAYALWLTFRRSSVAGLENESVPCRIRRVWPAFGISLLALLLAGGGIFRDLAFRLIPDRLAQIHGASAMGTDPAAKGTDPAKSAEDGTAKEGTDPAAKEGTDPAAKEGTDPVAKGTDPAAKGTDPAKSAEEKARENWIFATNWSLPPEDALEFVAPCVRGIETANYPGHGNYVYWGRLGRTWEWEKHKQGFPNFRQHTVYLGAAQVFFALFAIVAWFRSRRQGARQSPWLRDVPFWAVAAFAAIILSFGRYTPIYRLFYAIPGMNLLRAPVKLHHITEICTALLFGIGLACAFQMGTDPESGTGTDPAKLGTDPAKSGTGTDPAKSGTDPKEAQKGTDPAKSGKASRRAKGTDPAKGMGPVPAAFAAALPGIALVAASIFVRGGYAGLARTLAEMGFPAGAAEAFLPRMAGALLHGGLLWLAGVVVLLLARRGGAARAAAVALAWICVGGDLVAVARNYINPMDVSRIYRDNALTAAMLKDDSIAWPTVGQFVTNPMDAHDVLSLSVTAKGMGVAMRSQLQHAAAAALQRRPDVLLDVLAADYALIPETAAKNLPLPKFRPVERINVGAMLGAGRDFQALLLKRGEPQPFAAFVPGWEAVAADGQAAAALRPGHDAAGNPLIDAPESCAAYRGTGKAEVEAVRFFRPASAMDTVIRTHSGAAGMLAVRQYFDMPAEALVDGEKAPVYRCNCVWTAVPVPAGDHAVVIRHGRGSGAPLFFGVAALAVFAVSLAALMLGGPAARS